MELVISSPPEYQPGVYKIVVRLSSEENEHTNREKIYFDIPVISKWFFQIGNDFRFPSQTQTGHPSKGTIVNGYWEANIQTNGVLEEHNPIKIHQVEEALRASIGQSVSVFCDLNKQ